MGKRRRILLAALFLAAVVAMAWMLLSPRQPEPSYKGKPLGYWLEGYDPGNYKIAHPNGPAPPTDKEAGDAILQIGTNAIPGLLRRLQVREAKTTGIIVRLLQMQHIIDIPYANQNANFKALKAFSVLGSQASNAVPQLITLFERDHSAFIQTAVPEIFSEIGPAAEKATPVLLERGITHTNMMVRANTIFALRRMNAEPKLILPALIKCLNDPDILVRAQAVRTLGVSGGDAQPAVPALLELWRKEPRTTPGAATISIDGTIVSTAWGAYSLGFGATSPPDVVKLTAEALRAIDPEAAARAAVK